MTAVGRAAKIIAGLVRDGYEVVVSHGNGPQVGMIDRAMGMLAAQEPDLAQAPLSVCGNDAGVYRLRFAEFSARGAASDGDRQAGDVPGDAGGGGPVG